MAARSHVFVATTQGPVPITAITREESDVPSVVCINGSSERAGISSLYYDFVGKGTGVIAHETGHGAWRVDIQTNIENGQSWKLAFLLAHVLHSKGILGGGSPAPGDNVVWATGRVQFDRSVPGVRNLPRKLESTAELVRSCQEQGIKMVGFAPRENVDALPANWREAMEIPASAFPLHAVSGADAALAALKVDLDGRNTSDRRPPRRWSWGTASVVVLLSAAAIATAGFYSQSRERVPASDEATRPGDANVPGDADAPVPEQIVRRPERDPVLVPSRSEGSSGCATPEARRVPLAPDDDGFLTFKTIGLTDACSLHFEFPQPPAAGVVAVALKEAGIIELTSGGNGWSLPLPNRRDEDRAYALIVPSAAVTEDQRAAFERRLNLSGGGDLLIRGRLEELLEASGWTTTVYRQRLTIRVTPERSDDET